MDYKTVDDVHRGDIIDCDLRSCSFNFSSVQKGVMDYKTVDDAYRGGIVVIYEVVRLL